jgi:SWI/SNF-related matrix-associated actin-dependent regulator 1 of chromatin subfamily A
MTLYPYQDEGAAFLASHKRAMLLDEQGLGKTVQAIEACNRVGAKTVLVVCPASVRSNWHREFARFGAGQSVTVESYDKVARDWRRYDGPWDALIIDEAHYLKSPNARRTMAIYGGHNVTTRKQFPGLVGIAAHVFALTGTPAPNAATELYTHMSALRPESLAMASDATRTYDRFAFERRYCVIRETKFGSRIVGGKNHDDLKARLAGWTLRRLKRDVLPDLPVIAYHELLVEAPDALKALVDVPGPEMDKIRDVLKDGEAASLQSIAAEMATLRRVTALAKTPVLVEWVKEFLESCDRKIVIFGYHREPLDMLQMQLRDRRDGKAVQPALIAGNTRNDHRQAAVDRFQNDPECRVFIGQIQAAGTGLTLTAASDLVFLEQSWVPAENAQAAMRIHRIGQRRGCSVRYLTLAGSIDEGVQRALARKTRDLQQIFD